MKRYHFQRAAVIAVCVICGFLQIFYYSILRTCFPEFLKQHKSLADGISILITVLLAAGIYFLVTVILKANHQLWSLRQRMEDCAYVRLPASPSPEAGGVLTPRQLLEDIRERSRRDGWGQLEEVELCGETFDLLIVKGTSALYVTQAEHLTVERLQKARKAIAENVDAVGLRKRQDAVLCFCCQTADSDALVLAKTCFSRGKTCVYSAVLEGETKRGYCLLTDRKGRIQDSTCQKMLIKLVLGFPDGTVPQRSKSEEKNPGAGRAREELEQFRLYEFWKSAR